MCCRRSAIESETFQRTPVCTNCNPGCSMFSTELDDGGRRRGDARAPGGNHDAPWARRGGQALPGTPTEAPAAIPLRRVEG